MSVDDRTDSFDDALTRSDHTDPDDVHSLAERLRRQVREARGGGAPEDFERTRKVDTDPYAFDTAPTAIENETPTIMDPELTPSAENAPELVAALAQFSGRALQEAKFQAASDGRGAARYAGVAAPARSIGVVDPNAGEVIVASNTTQPFLPAAAPMARPLTPGAQLAPLTPSGPFAQPAREERVAVTRKLRPGVAAHAETTVPGLRSRKGRAGQRKVLAVLLLGALVLVVAAVLLVKTLTTGRQPEVDKTTPPANPVAQAASVTGATSAVSLAAAPSSSPAPATTPTAAPLASATIAAAPTSPPPSVATSTSRRPEPPSRASAPTTAPVAPGVSTHSAPSSPATASSPKPEPTHKGDYVW